MSAFQADATWQHPDRVSQRSLLHEQSTFGSPFRTLAENHEVTQGAWRRQTPTHVDTVIITQEPELCKSRIVRRFIGIFSIILAQIIRDRGIALSIPDCALSILGALCYPDFLLV